MKFRNSVAGIMKFTIPDLNIISSDYIELIDWRKKTITQPPLIMKVSDAVVADLGKSGDSPIVDFPRIPSYTHAVERCVKLVTQASAAVCGQTSRYGFTRSRLEDRRFNANF